jgi:hypothetical protein
MMMKHISIIAAFLFTMSAQAHSNSLNDFLEASHEAVEMSQAVYGDDSIVAFMVEDEGHEIEVSVLTEAFGDTFTTIYGCHEHDDHFDCHQESEVQAPLNEGLARVSYRLLRSGERAAFNMIPDRLKSSLSSYVVFATGAGHDQYVWVRLNFDINGEEQAFFAGCHDAAHGGHSHFHCHVYRNGPATQPEFE